MCREQDKPVFQRIEGGLDIRHGHPGVHPYLMGEITIEIPRGRNGGAVGIPWAYPPPSRWRLFLSVGSEAGMKLCHS
jgi:hypothetical protein